MIKISQILLCYALGQKTNWLLTELLKNENIAEKMIGALEKAGGKLVVVMDKKGDKLIEDL
jgi:hypothetical protein